MKPTKRVIVAIMLLAAVTVLALPRKQRSSVPRDRVEIRYWEKWSGVEAEQMKQIVEDFNRTVGVEKGIFVRYMSMSQVDQKMLISTAAGVPPDVAGITDPQLAPYAAMNALEPLDDLAAEYDLTADYYKPVYYQTCTYEGKLYGLPSTPTTTALHWNKRVFRAKSAELRAAGLDPERPPQTIDELDRYAAALDTWQIEPDGTKRLISIGYLPNQPDWFLSQMPYWFDAELYDEQRRVLTLTDPRVVACLDWMAGYSRRLGTGAMSQFPKGLGSFDSPQNPLLIGAVAMEMQGPWMANFVRNLAPAMNNRRRLSAEELERLTAEQRKDNCDWGAAPFPSAIPGLENVSYCGLDILVIPRGSRHKREAFEFIAYVNQRDIMEKLCSMHSKHSPLAEVSESFVREHVNPYIDVFEMLSRSPNARALPRLPLFPELNDEFIAAAQRAYLLEVTPLQALQEAQIRVQPKIHRFFARQAARQNGLNHEDTKSRTEDR